METTETNIHGDGEEIVGFQKEMMTANRQLIKEVQDRSGWFFLAKDVAEWTGVSLFQIMETSANEVFGIVRIMKDKIFLNELTSKNKTQIA